MIIYPRSVIAWNIRSVNDINEDSMALFKVILPRPDIMIFGLDNDYPRDTPFINDFRRIVKNLKINLEILPVDKACTTFNFLNSENRYVVGAFLPPRQVIGTDAMKLQRAAVRRALHEPERGVDDP